MDTEGFLRIEDVARFLGLGRSRVYALCRAGELPVLRVGRSLRISQRELHAWAERRITRAAGSMPSEG